MAQVDWPIVIGRGFFALIIFCLVPFAHGKSSGGSGGSGGSSGSAFHLVIPVRLSVLGGFQSSTNGFDGEYSGYKLSGPTVGGDFYVPFKPIHSLIGLTGWVMFPSAKSGEQESFVLVGPYLGYMGERVELVAGVAASDLRHSKNGPAPLKQTILSLSMGCGFMGLRGYFGLGNAALGAGINGYFCQGSSFDKSTTDSSLIETKLNLASSAQSSGAMVFLMISWGEERTLH